jgi:hypothetical protein
MLVVVDEVGVVTTGAMDTSLIGGEDSLLLLRV